MINKRGDQKYYIIISLILGLMVLGLSLYFIFHEYLTEDDLDWQACRQSIVLRANSPELKKWDSTFASFKDTFPLKCKTQVIEVDKEGVKDLGKIVGDTLVQCWGLYDYGDSMSFPSPSGTWLLGSEYASICVPCARIHLTEDAKQELENSHGGEVNIEEFLKTSYHGEVTYYNYLTQGGKKFSPFDLAASRVFNLGGDEFIVNDSISSGFIFFRNRMSSEPYEVGASFAEFTLPKKMYQDKGDLVINYGIITTSEGFDDVGNYVPYLFYYQMSQDSDPILEMKKGAFFGNVEFGPLGEKYLSRATSFCSYWDGIPA